MYELDRIDQNLQVNPSLHVKRSDLAAELASKPTEDI